MVAPVACWPQALVLLRLFCTALPTAAGALVHERVVMVADEWWVAGVDQWGWEQCGHLDSHLLFAYRAKLGDILFHAVWRLGHRGGTRTKYLRRCATPLP